MITEIVKHNALVALMNAAAMLKDPESFTNIERLMTSKSLLNLHSVIEEMDTESEAVLNMFSQADSEPNDIQVTKVYELREPGC